MLGVKFEESAKFRAIIGLLFIVEVGKD